MTRTRIIFCQKDGRRYVSPEFNGDREELLRRGATDSCELSLSELLALFGGVENIPDFAKANILAQGQYHSQLGNMPPLTIRNLPRNRALPAADKLVFVFQRPETPESRMCSTEGPIFTPQGNPTINEMLRNAAKADGKVSVTPVKQEPTESPNTEEMLRNLMRHGLICVTLPTPTTMRVCNAVFESPLYDISLAQPVEKTELVAAAVAVLSDALKTGKISFR